MHNDLFGNIRTAPITQDDIALAQRTFNEAALYRAVATFARAWFRIHRRPARILDLCSASGLTSLVVLETIPVRGTTLVDLDISALDMARKRLAAYSITALEADAIHFKAKDTYDIILMNSAYHHIPDNCKAQFLSTAAGNLTSNGTIIVADHFLPPYGDNLEFKFSVEAFYSALLIELRERGTDLVAIEIIRQAAFQCWNKDTEFKVSWPVFLEHLSQSELAVVDTIVAWQHPAADLSVAPVGSIAIALEKSTEEVI